MLRAGACVKKSFLSYLTGTQLRRKSGCLAQPSEIHNTVIEIWEGPLFLIFILEKNQLYAPCSHGGCHSSPREQGKLPVEWLNMESCLIREKENKAEWRNHSMESMESWNQEKKRIKQNGRLGTSFILVFSEHIISYTFSFASSLKRHPLNNIIASLEV